MFRINITVPLHQRFASAYSRFRMASIALLCLIGLAAANLGAQGRNDERAPRPPRTPRVPTRPVDFETRLDTTVKVERGTIVDLSASDGKIVVRGWDRDEVEIRAVSETGELQFSRSAKAVRVEARRGGNRSRTLDATINVRVPLNTRVVVGTMLGDVEVLDVRGEVDANLYSGDITIRGSSGRTSISNVSGDINVSEVDGSLHVTAISGEMVLSEVRGDVSVNSNSGDVSMRAIQSNMVQVQVVEGDIAFDGAFSKDGRYAFNTHSGDVSLWLPENTKASIGLQSFSGSLRTAFPVTLQPGAGSSRPPTSNLRQSSARPLSLTQPQQIELGGGGAQVSIQTFEGDVNISRGPRRTTRGS
ncbi:MAG: DUF4097 family beta strand repeat-containing protein [Gemmatimonas sp.]